MTGSKQVRREPLESGDDAVMDWVLFPPEKPGDSFGFEFRKDCDCGSLDHLHIEPEDVAPLIRFLGGVPLSDLQRVLDDMDAGELIDPDPTSDGYFAATHGVRRHLGIDVERKD